MFFVRLQNGRPHNEDITTMKLVLEAAPEIGQRYGVIIPAVRAKEAKAMKQSGVWCQIYAGIFNDSIVEEQRCNMIFMQAMKHVDRLDGENEVLPEPNELQTLEGETLMDFIANLPSVNLTV